MLTFQRAQITTEPQRSPRNIGAAPLVSFSLRIYLLFIGTCFCPFFNYGDEFVLSPPQQFTLSPEYIAGHHPVKTNQVCAQLYFDQGLTFHYAFNHEAAYWSFLKASELDPDMAMAYWGMALVLGPNINLEITPKREQLAFDSVQKALRLAETGPSNERAYISALKERYSRDANPNRKELNLRYSDAMKKLMNQFPDDLDAAVLYAESLLDVNPWNQWSLSGKPQQGTNEATAALESVLIRSPMHLGANHYYIHLLETSPFPYRALLSAERLKTLLPSSGHILHMSSHIFLLVGDYEQAVGSNEKAIAADREYIRQYGIKGIYPVIYLLHNYHFLSQAYSMQGNYQGAKQAAKGLLDLYLPHFASMPGMESYAYSIMFVYLGFHQWNEILNLPQPPALMRVTRALWHFSRGVAFASLGNLPQALEEQKLFFKETQLPATTKYDYNSVSRIFKLTQDYLEAKLAEAQHQNERVIDYLQKAVVEQDQLGSDEPPNRLFSVRNSLGVALLNNNRFADAEEVFREDLKRHPRSGRSLFGLKKSLEAQSKWADYYWVDQAFQQAWRFSDVELNIDRL